MKKAILLLSMGGPSDLKSVKPFLFNLFNDPAILRLPLFLRKALAFLISTLRAPVAAKHYKAIGGFSPLLQNTKKQAQALQNELNANDSLVTYRCFVGMSYWHPFIKEVAEEVKAFHPDEIILLPMYPQYSTTTTASVFRDAEKHLGPCQKIETYHHLDRFIYVMAENTRRALKGKQAVKVLFVAHGLPISVVKAGDPYVQQCEETSANLAQNLPEGTNWTLCYQSRVGPMKWTEPYLDDAVRDAAASGRDLVVVPISFVAEHIETLYELKIETRMKALKQGARSYEVVDTVGADPIFIKGLADQLTKT